MSAPVLVDAFSGDGGCSVPGAPLPNTAHPLDGQLMGVPWMRSRKSVSNAIPPTFTEYLGEQLLAHLVSA